MSTPYIGEIRAVGFTFAPPGWLPCNGQPLPISQYDTLFALIGTTYGGDGQNTFNLPNLNGRVAVGSQNGAAGPGLSSYQLGQAGGSETVTLTTAQLPAHPHPFAVPLAASTAGTVGTDPPGRLPGQASRPAYASAPQSGRNLAPAPLSGNAGSAGSGQAHPNVQPVLALNYIIATDGIFPPRP